MTISIFNTMLCHGSLIDICSSVELNGKRKTLNLCRGRETPTAEVLTTVDRWRLLVPVCITNRD